MLALNYTYGDILEDSYTDIFDAHAIANQLLAIQLQQTKQEDPLLDFKKKVAESGIEITEE